MNHFILHYRLTNMNFSWRFLCISASQKKKKKKKPNWEKKKASLKFFKSF